MYTGVMEIKMYNTFTVSMVKLSRTRDTIKTREIHIETFMTHTHTHR